LRLNISLCSIRVGIPYAIAASGTDPYRTINPRIVASVARLMVALGLRSTTHFPSPSIARTHE
jgi:hypothetical protein